MGAGRRRGRGGGRRSGCSDDGRGGAEWERYNFLRGDVFPVQFVQPEGESVSVFLWEGGVDESQREQLPALVEVLLCLAGAEEDLGQETHVLLPGLYVPRVEEREVGQQQCQSLLLCLTVEGAEESCKKKKQREVG